MVTSNGWLFARRLVTVLALCVGGMAVAADPAHYLRGDTWQETLLASLERLEASGLEIGPGTFRSEVMRGGDPPRRVRVTVAGAQELYLFVRGDPDVIWGVATWADPRLIASDGAETLVCEAKDFDILEGRHSLDINLRAGLYQPLAIGGRGFEHGLHVQAESAVRVRLGGRFETFECWIGVDDWAGKRGNVRFTVAGAREAARELLWTLLERDFPEAEPRRQMRWERADRIFEPPWKPGDFVDLVDRYTRALGEVPELVEAARRIARQREGREALEGVRDLYYRRRALDAALRSGRRFSGAGLRLAIENLRRTYGEAYPDAGDYLEDLADLELAMGAALRQVDKEPTLEAMERGARISARLDALRSRALLAHPRLDFDRLLLLRRTPIGEPRRRNWDDKGLGEFIGLPRQSSWGNSTIPGTDRWENEIAVLSPVRPEGDLETIFRPERRRLLSDLDLDFDGRRILFAMPDERLDWQIWEVGADGEGLRQLTPNDTPGIHNYEPCYLPGGDIIFVSTAPLQGVPCNASVVVGMIYRMDGDGGSIRQICFEQDHDYSPSVLNDGRVLYLRWDYTDTPHIWNRILMSMNPDGTGQMEYYGSNSYWPNAVFYARAIPDHPTKIAGIVTGHHEGRIGELVIFDPARGRREAEGVVQRIPGRWEPVEPVLEDKLTEHSWPKTLHPFPLDENFFIVSSKPTPDSLWGIYLVDTFDNRVLLHEEERRVLVEPIPLRPTSRPPIIADRTEPERDDALVYLVDVHRGPGLRGVPAGTARSLRVFTYHFGYQNLAGIDHRVGSDGPWEVKRVLGTVPLEEDGSAFFRVPARTPISVQPLDAEGKALALMRSWMTAMPGEVVSCVGCHEQQQTVPSNLGTLASKRAPSEIRPWRGPTRGFSFRREVQPVLDRFCVGCHDGRPDEEGHAEPDLRRDPGFLWVYRHGDPELSIVEGVPRGELVAKYAGVFDAGYVALRRLVRVGGLESDLHLLPPMEFHADTSELIQMLQKGHHAVELDGEAWDRLVTWIDLNAPCHGTWAEVQPIPRNQRQRRLVLRRRYGGVPVDFEVVPSSPGEDTRPVVPRPAEPRTVGVVDVSGWPFDAAEAVRRQSGGGGPATRALDLGAGVSMELVRIPAGSFVMGDARHDPDERPPARVEIVKPFWMSRYEVTNEQYARFDPAHDSRFEHRTSWIFSEEYVGWPLNRPRQPVVRITWKQALGFCEWLSGRCGDRVRLPTEAQWEYACRAGSDADFSFGGFDDDIAAHANVGDRTLRDLAYEGWRPRAPDLVARDDGVDDGTLVTAEVGRFRPNVWGLHDMHGNVAEWTRTTYRPYPYRRGDGRDEVRETGRKVVRGGSWRDRPVRCRSAFRLSYLPYQPVYNVGFRVVIEDEAVETVMRRR